MNNTSTLPKMGYYSSISNLKLYGDHHPHPQENTLIYFKNESSPYVQLAYNFNFINTKKATVRTVEDINTHYEVM